MAVDSEHPDYTTRKVQWEKLSDCNEGQEAIHAKGVKYLPKLSGQSNDDYKAYLNRTLFYGATARTIDGLTGMIFRKAPIVEVPQGLQKMIDDVTLDGMNLIGFAEDIVQDVVELGRAGILVDHPATPTNTTVATAEALNIRPFLKHYDAESIFNWKTASVNNALVLTQVRLWECVPTGTTEFDDSERKQIRILDLNELGQYRQRIFVEKKVVGLDGEKWEQFGDDIIPLKGGLPLNFIPFYFAGVKNGLPDAEKPPLIDLANANLSHYVSTADLEHGAHFTALPTAVITGHTEEEVDKTTEYRIGAANAWVFPNAETQVQYLEFQGQGLGALETRVQKKEEYMAFLGARMLSPDKKAVESAEAANIHRAGESSVLASIAASVSQTIEDAVRFMAEWAGMSGNVVFKLNNDFAAVKMSAQELTALFQTYQGGGMAFADFLYNLKRGEIIQEDRTEEDIRSEIETSNPFGNQDVNTGS
jgi:hypothetical protein